MRLVIVATHPIQHFCPQYRSVAAIPGIELTVVFASLKGVEPYHDVGFGAEVSWGAGLLEGFDYLVMEERKSLARILNRLSPDWLVVYGYASPIARRAWLWALRHPARNLAYISDSESRHEVVRSLRNRVRSVLLRVLFRRITAFLTVGDANEEYYAAHGADASRFVRMHFPIDPALGVAPKTGTDLRAELGITRDTVMVLNVGKFEPHKRQVDLIAAIVRVPNAHLVLAGSGAQLEHCQRAATGLGNVTFLGFQQPRELAALYAAADVYVHPSTYDRHPLAVSEAAAAGTALVVSDRTGSWGASDDVIPGETGYVIPARDVDAIVAALQKFADDPKLAQVMGRCARENSRRFQARAHGGFVEDLRRQAGTTAEH